MKILPRSKSKDGLAYHKIGSGPPLVFIHGVGLRAESWAAQIDYFKSRFTVYALDLPGHGESDALQISDPDVQAYTDKITDFINEDIGQSSIICGHSLGALIALDLHQRYPKPCAAIAAISTIYQRGDEAFKAVKSRAKYIKDNPEVDLAISPIARWFEDVNSGQARVCRDMIESNSAAGYSAAYGAFAKNRGASADGIKSASVPLLFLTGETDYNSTPAMSEALAALSKMASAVIIKEARHMVLLTHAKETIGALDAFVKKAQDR